MTATDGRHSRYPRTVADGHFERWAAVGASKAEPSSPEMTPDPAGRRAESQRSSLSPEP